MHRSRAMKTRKAHCNARGRHTCDGKDEPLDYVHKTNLKATEYLKVGGRTRVQVIETERYKAFQRNRPPPPNIPSQCQSPHYDSQCFDPSGGMSSKKQAAFRDTAR